MKVKFYLSIGYPNASQEDVFDVEDLGFSPDEWKKMSEFEKYENVRDWAGSYIELYYEEVKD